MKRIIMIAVAALCLMCAHACAEERLSIVATNFPCYDFARQVAGDLADVTMLIKPGMEVHSYDPSPADIRMIGDADLFVYIGGESDAWADTILSGFEGSEGPTVLRLMDSVDDLAEEEHDEEDKRHETPEYDEHIWTSPINAKKMVAAISVALCAMDEEHLEEYAENAHIYNERIDDIDDGIREVIRKGERRELVFADRFPFLYLVREYSLDYMAAFPSCSAETETSPRTVLRLIHEIMTKRIPVVYVIEMSTGSLAQTVSGETGAEIVTLHSMQTVSQEEFEAGETYVSLMKKNVEALRRGLQ